MIRGWVWAWSLSALLASQRTVAQIQLDINDPDSVKAAAATTAYDMMAYYHGNESGHIPGKLPGTWWEGGAMFMTLIQYWFWTGDDSYNEVTQQGMYWQKGHNDYFPHNYSQYLGNDDQVFWGLAAMTAAELNFPQQDGQPSWLTLAMGVYNSQIARWDTRSCAGGLTWQIWPYQAGYTIKNSISNGGLFQLAARLAYYTRNDTYAQWAEKIWDWSETTPLLNADTWTVEDTTSTGSNCTDHEDLQWSYNYGTYFNGAAYLYNYTDGREKWKRGMDGLLNTTYAVFFPEQYGGNIMSEVACEPEETCNRNMSCFKAFLSTWLAFVTTLASYTAKDIVPKLQASALGAAEQCSGGADKKHCGRRWYQEKWDGYKGLEEQMSALGIFSTQMITQHRGGNGIYGGHGGHGGNGSQEGAGRYVVTSRPPFTSVTGGRSMGNPNAGEWNSAEPIELPPITTADRAGAGVVTVVFMCGWISALTYMHWGG